jgi:hypothetical protein
MSGTEKKIAVALVVVLAAMVGVYLLTGNKAQSAPAVRNPLLAQAGGAAAGAPQSAAAPQAAGGAVCAPSGASTGSVATQGFGKQGAKLEIVAALPITHGCHVETEAELKKAYEKHPNDIHLTIYDLFGPEGQKYVAEHGGQRAVVFINGESTFEMNGKSLRLEMLENGTYSPSDLVPLIESLLKKQG